MILKLTLLYPIIGSELVLQHWVRAKAAFAQDNLLHNVFL